MKPYGLRPGDGEKSNRATQSGNKFNKTIDEGGPKGKHKESKIHDQRRLAHRQARSDQKKEIREALKEECFCPRVIACMPCEECNYPYSEAKIEWDGITPHE